MFDAVETPSSRSSWRYSRPTRGQHPASQVAVASPGSPPLILVLALGMGCAPPHPGTPAVTAPDDSGQANPDGDSASPTDSADTATDSSGPHLPEPTLEVVLETGPAITCPEPDARAELGAFAFVEDTEGLGAFPIFEGGLPGATMSMAVGDINADGHVDLLYGRPYGIELMFGQGDGTFVTAPTDAWPTSPDPERLVSGSLLLDLDADGDLDAIVTHRTHPPARYINRGDGTFDAFWDLGEAPQVTGHMGPSAGDINGDGTLELLVGGHQESGAVDGTFPPPLPGAAYHLSPDGIEEASIALPSRAHDGYTFVTSILDLNNDSRPDAYIANDHGAFAPGNAVLWGQGSPPERSLSPEESPSGLEHAMAAMGVGVGDLNHDGLPDLAVSNWGPPLLLLSDPHFGWVDAALSRGVVDTPTANVGWGTDLADFDNDGDLDIYMTFGHVPGASDAARPNEPRQPDKFFENDGAAHFTDIAPSLGIDDRYVGRTAMMVDLDGNGFLDLLLARQFRSPKVWLARCDARQWLRVRLSQPGPNPHAIGAKVQVVTPDGTQTRWMQAGGRSFGASHPHVAHFGLDHSAEVDRLLVTWPDGAVSEVTEVAARQEIRVIRPAAE